MGQNYSGTEPLDVICLVTPELLSKEDEYVKAINQENLKISFRCSDKWLETYGDMSSSPMPGLKEWSDLHPYISVSANHRVFLGSVCSEFDKAIYFDADTMFFRSPQPMIDYPVINGIVALQEFSDLAKLLYGTMDIPYFNNGVFITDLNWWRENRVEEKLLDWQKTNGITHCPEQDAMNAVLHKFWQPAPVSFNTFNFLIDTNADFKFKNRSPIIVHFVGPSKPWVSGQNGSYCIEWRLAYRSITGKDMATIL